jgi:hypothetical protein
MLDPPIASGANIFIIIALSLIALGAATVAVDVFKTAFQNKKQSEDD